MLVNLRSGYAAFGWLCATTSPGRGSAGEHGPLVAGGFPPAALVRRLRAGQLRFVLEGKGEDAWRRLEAAWRPLERSLLLRSQFIRIGAVFLRGRTALASGRRREARDAVTSLEREGAGWSMALATLLRASLAPEAGRVRARRRLLDRAELRMHAAVARDRAGEDDRWWSEQGVVRPERLRPLLRARRIVC